MNCEEVMELMQRSLDGDLDSAETSRMKEHIQTCPECAAMFERLTLLSDNLAQLPRVAPSFSIVDSILPRLEQIVPEKAPDRQADAESGEPADLVAPGTSRPARRNYRRWAGAIAAGVAAGLLIVAWPSLRSSLSDQNRSFDSASMAESGSSAAATPSASASDQRLFVKFSQNVGSQGATADSAPEAGAAQTPKAAEPSLKAIAPSDSGGENKSDTPGVQADKAAPSASPGGSEENAPMTSLAAPSAGEGTGGGTTGDTNAPANEPSASASASFGIASALRQADVWNSPDGKYKATVEDNRLKVYQTSDGALAFESGEHPDSKIADVVWDDDSAALHYTWTDASGKSTKLEWTAATGQESADSGADGNSP